MESTTSGLFSSREGVETVNRFQGCSADQFCPAPVRHAVMDLADLAAKALEEAAQVFEGLALIVLALHPEVMRGRSRRKRAPRATTAPRP